MPITFELKESDNYFITKYVGIIRSSELLDSWIQFLEGNNWIPGLNELADLSEADLSELNKYDLVRLSMYVDRIYAANNIKQVRVAVFAPSNVPFGMSKMYEAYSEQSTELVQVFRRKEEALEWLLHEK